MLTIKLCFASLRADESTCWMSLRHIFLGLVSSHLLILVNEGLDTRNHMVGSIPSPSIETLSAFFGCAYTDLASSALISRDSVLKYFISCQIRDILFMAASSHV